MRKPTLSLLAVVFSTACGPQHAMTAEQRQQQADQLRPLADELNRTSLRGALENRGHFSPLCDENGYPLVGNVVGKVPPQTSVADFCAEQRK